MTYTTFPNTVPNGTTTQNGINGGINTTNGQSQYGGQSPVGQYPVGQYPVGQYPQHAVNQYSGQQIPLGQFPAFNGYTGTPSFVPQNFIPQGYVPQNYISQNWGVPNSFGIPAILASAGTTNFAPTFNPFSSLQNTSSWTPWNWYSRPQTFGGNSFSYGHNGFVPSFVNGWTPGNNWTPANTWGFNTNGYTPSFNSTFNPVNGYGYVNGIYNTFNTPFNSFNTPTFGYVVSPTGYTTLGVTPFNYTTPTTFNSPITPITPITNSFYSPFVGGQSFGVPFNGNPFTTGFNTTGFNGLGVNSYGSGNYGYGSFGQFPSTFSPTGQFYGNTFGQAFPWQNTLGWHPGFDATGSFHGTTGYTPTSLHTSFPTSHYFGGYSPFTAPFNNYTNTLFNQAYGFVPGYSPVGTFSGINGIPTSPISPITPITGIPGVTPVSGINECCGIRQAA